MGVKVILPLRKPIGIAHPGLQHFIEIISGLGRFDKINVKELSGWLETISYGEDLRAEVSKLQPYATIESAVFCVGVFNNPFNRVTVRENARSSSNAMDTGIPDSMVGGLVILNVRKVIVVENRVCPRPIFLVGFTDSATSIRKKKCQCLGP